MTKAVVPRVTQVATVTLPLDGDVEIGDVGRVVAEIAQKRLDGYRAVKLIVEFEKVVR